MDWTVCALRWRGIRSSYLYDYHHRSSYRSQWTTTLCLGGATKPYGVYQKEDHHRIICILKPETQSVFHSLNEAARKVFLAARGSHGDDHLRSSLIFDRIWLALRNKMKRFFSKIRGELKICANSWSTAFPLFHKYLKKKNWNMYVLLFLNCGRQEYRGEGSLRVMTGKV